MVSGGGAWTTDATAAGADADALTERARTAAEELLSGQLPRRWRHTQAVAAQARLAASAVPAADRAVLVAAAWLHDIGYAAPTVDSGFHPLDGARWLTARRWPPRICALVAHHSGAAYVARALGLSASLARYPWERSAVSDALVYADQTAGPDGEPASVRERIADAARRHGPRSAYARAHQLRGPYLLAAVERTEGRLAALAGG